ncbi:YdeI family protein [Kineosporia sp. R_H_3]|uniref:YdeI/OmpD-associated family protein n=1 Tax=Kineosporia sp. R_H_3 TaxID=1961848 RepID=UPI000B4A9CE1|nr:YdeI/OmpD-associated family protein [Kineosporia sp. R_H_3]
MADAPGEPRFFATPAAWRGWLAEHAATASELLVGFHKKGTETPSLTWPQSVEEALCFGWIDGVRRSLGPDAYSIRFTPRRPGSHWSRVNVDLVERLESEGRMTDAGRAAFAARTEERTAKASYEQREHAVLEPEHEALFRADAAAWDWFGAAPAGYRRLATYWVVSAKRPATRLRRLMTLVECSREGRKIPSLA